MPDVKKLSVLGNMEDISRNLFLLFITLFGTILPFDRAAQAQSQVTVTPSSESAGIHTSEPEREHRGVWMATVLNIDYPQNPTPSAAGCQH